jgi:hypothetical protein
MPATAPQSLSSIGFLTVSEHQDQGLFGGYLVLNTAGRPMEFHCTAPVRPNRAQEILYGPTLRPYLYGEQIGRALLERASSLPQLVFTDAEPALSVRDLVAVPVVYVGGGQVGSADSVHRVDPGHAEPPPSCRHRLHRFVVGPHQLAVPHNHREDESEVLRHWQPHAEEFDLAEPFGRIREAIEEARRSAR